ncbi:S-layer homology domain-containing protein [Paenibacillus sp. YPG26]|uniref:S-layer homology domain-containing protein n=1 Tax=Paenibacillus sp. YPG26 TaxID=2878915 RepID=UPI0020424F2D|nr:S-layer homology domain-containing protein [Paenibacillus sp. YPG26]USB32862.1 S-layer homology domain-containing protein [Paenibacillus sp. YPG26]
MQRVKKPLVWLMLLTMIVSLIPVGLTGIATAATSSAATYFIPDSTGIRQTALLTTEPGAQQINRSNVYATNNSALTIGGTFSYVAKDTMKVKVEQLVSEPVVGNGVRWVPDGTHFTTSSVTADPVNLQKFTATNLGLFAGFNKITFTGMQGSIERSDIFYVLYDKVPYVDSLKIYGSSQGAILLNEGTQVVVDSKTVTLQGVAQNTNKVTVSVNGGTALVATVLQDGTFFSPTLNLKSGQNDLKVSIQNGSDAVAIARTVYFFDKIQPFTGLQATVGTETLPILDNKPTFTKDSNITSGYITGEVLVPYVSDSFKDKGIITVNGGSQLSFDILKDDGSIGTASDEKIIPGPDGITPAYRLVKFRTNVPYNLQTDSGSPAKVLTEQKATIAVTYGTLTAAYPASFRYLPGDTVITDMKYLEKFKVGDDITKATKLPLNGANVDSQDFYILVESNTVPSQALIANYLPLGTKAVTLSKVSVTGLPVNQEVYHVTGFSNGQQKVRFQYSGSSSWYNADISYVSKNYIYIDNLTDGQTFEFDSRTTNRLPISGKYLGFENISNAEYFVNGIAGTTLNAGVDGDDTVLGVTGTTPSFALNLNITASGPLFYGDNKIVFSGTSMDGAGNKRVITKELHIYIIDKNISKIDSFLPNAALDTRTPFTKDVAGDNDIANILAPSPEFVFADGKYTTTQQKYDLVLRGSGATVLNLNLGTDLFFSSSTDSLLGDPKILKAPGTFSYKGTTYTYDFSGNKDDFILRIRNIAFDAPGSHVYNLEMINATGARANQRLEVVREVSPYRILAPQPTVGKQYIVNKNFVHFDIEAEGATKVIIGKEEATKRPDLGTGNRFLYDYVGLKPDKATTIKIQIVRNGVTLNDTITVYYTGTVAVDSQFMAEKVATKYSVFNKSLELSFPKGTLMKTASPDGNSVTKFYPNTKLLFGIADPKDGVVERRNDYGNLLGIPNTGVVSGFPSVALDDLLLLKFTSNANTSNFSRVSDIFWVSGGVGEKGDLGSSGYKPATNGVAPYSLEGQFTKFEAERKIVPSNRGTMKIGFNKSIVDEVGSTITAFRYTDQGVWENIGGEVDMKSHTISVPFDEFGYYTVMKLRLGYNDITNHPWARNYLNGLYAKGIMNNLRSDAFGADDRTTRGEFATLIVKGLNLPLNYDNNQQTFFDIKPTVKAPTWDFEHLETAARAGIVTGLSDGFFGPDQPLTREQAAVMIARALKLKTATNDTKLKATLAKAFTDSGTMDSYSMPSIDAVSKAKIMSGNPQTVAGQKKPTYAFNPKGTLTRAEAGKIAVALLLKSTKIFPKNLS